MKTKIFKYRLRHERDFTLQIPAGMIPLTINQQAGGICLWAEVHPEAEEVETHFHCIRTGESVPEGKPRKIYHEEYEPMGKPVYIGTGFVGGEVRHFYYYPYLAMPAGDVQLPEDV